MAALRLLVAAILLPAGVCTLLPSGNEVKPPARALRAGPEQNKALVSHSAKSSRRHGMRSSVPEQLETWHDSGLAVKSTLSAADIVKLSSSITAEAFQAQLHAIVDPDPTRFIATKGNELAATNIKKTFESFGLQTEVQPVGITPSLTQYMSGSSSLAGNVMGYMKGTDRADEVVIVACHYDSVNWENLSAAAPGVDDNGSGVALMLLLAKTFAQGAVKPRRSLLFVSFQAEEEGLVGSKEFAKLFMPGGAGFSKYGRPVAAIIADEVAWPGSSAATRRVIFETKGQGQATNIVVDTMAHAAQEQCSGGFKDCVNGFVVNYHGFGSDHIPLLDVGVPAILLIEKDNMYHADKWGHSAEDDFKHIDPAFGAATTRLALQAVATLATPAA